MYANVFKDKKLSETDFDELVEHCSGKVLTGLLEEGGKGLRSAVYHAMAMAIDREKYLEEDAAKKKARARKKAKKSTKKK